MLHATSELIKISKNLFRNANKGDILKAYRKKAQEWHPDNFRDENQKKIAEKNFVDIAAAKEVSSFRSSRGPYKCYLRPYLECPMLQGNQMHNSRCSLIQKKGHSSIVEKIRWTRSKRKEVFIIPSRADSRLGKMEVHFHSNFTLVRPLFVVLFSLD